MAAKSFLKLLALAAAAGAAGGGAWWYQSQGTADQQRLEEQARHIAYLTDVAERLTLESRVARIVVTARSEDDGTPVTDLLFFEIGADGEELPAKPFTVRGDRVHVAGKVIRFDESFVAEGDALRGRSIVLWDRIHGSATAPDQGATIDPEGEPPRPYRRDDLGPGEPADRAAFEAELWDRFWELASDRDLAAERGVRVAYGQAVYGVFEPGRVYELTLQANGGLTLYADEMPPLYRELLRALEPGRPDAAGGAADGVD